MKRLIWNEEALGSEGRAEGPLHIPAFVTDLCSLPWRMGCAIFGSMIITLSQSAVGEDTGKRGHGMVNC